MIEFMDAQLCMELKRWEGGVEDLGNRMPSSNSHMFLFI